MFIQTVGNNIYTYSGDIIVLIICFLIFILIKVSYIERTKAFTMFEKLIAALFITTGIRVLFFALSKNYNGENDLYNLILMELYSLYQIGSYTILYMFFYYLMHPLHVDPKICKSHMIFMGSCYTLAVIYTLLSPLFDLGISVTERNGLIKISEPFYIYPYICYFFLFFITVQMLYYRKRIYKQIIIGIMFSCFFSILIVFVQKDFGQISYSTVTFLLPLISAFYLIHSNPYDMEIGTLNSKEFSKMLEKENNKKPMIILELYLNALEKSDKDFPLELRKALRDDFGKHFNNILIFQISPGRILFTAPLLKNDKYKKRVKSFVKDSNIILESNDFDYKITVITSNIFNCKMSELLSLMKFVGGKIDYNEYKIIDKDDIESFKSQVKILSILKDIFYKNDLNDERVLVYCQPVYNVSSKKYDTGESLVRLHMDDGSILNPGAFIPLAEKNGFIYMIGKIVLYKTCLQIKDFLEKGYVMKRISVNFSVHDFKNPFFGEDILSIIRKVGIPHNYIAIEITETQDDTEFYMIKNQMNKLKDSGIKFYLDDFGTGYSNYERITELPFDIIKFDRSLVLASKSSNKSKTMVKNMANIFKNMNYTVLYEGVETVEDTEMCKSMLGDYLQGFCYSKPVRIEDMNKFFKKNIS